MTKWHFEKPKIPVSGALLSLLALSVPVLASTTLAEGAFEYEALIWLSALIPAFMLAYYRGWRGVALGFALAMVVLTATQLMMFYVGVRLPNWPLMLTIMGMFIGISLLLGGVVDRLHEARSRAEELALYDPLTGLPNRRHLDLMLAKAFAAARRGVPLVVVAFDLDNFKAFNDRYGHPAGDDLLREFAGVLGRHTRTMNTSARVGGEEFVSIVSSSTVEGALVFTERVRDGVEKIAGPEKVTVSAGVAAYHDGVSSEAELLAAADEALYRAKADGRDRIAVAKPDAAAAPAASPGVRASG